LPDFNTPIDFRDRDLGVFVQLPSDGKLSYVYRVAWHYSCGADAACDFSTQLDLGRTYLNTRIPADAVEMAADIELLTTPRDQRQMLIGASESPGDCQEKLFDRWTVKTQEKSIVVSDGTTSIPVSPDFIKKHGRARIVDCAVFRKGNELAWLAYAVDLFGPVGGHRAVTEQPRRWLVLQILELKQEYLEFLANRGDLALRNHSNGVLAASATDFEVKLVEEVLREPVWSKEIWRKDSAKITIREMILDERYITLNREDSLQAFKLAWSADALLDQACALLGWDGSEEPLEYHSAEFRMFKRDLTQQEGGQLEGTTPGEPNVDGICQGAH
jgi:hypothetical protein